MKEIFTGNGIKILVDDEDYERLMQYKWHLDKDGYAISFEGSHRFLMHREVLKPAHGFIIHHLDGNKLNNQKLNLERLAENKHNRMTRIQALKKLEYTYDPVKRVPVVVKSL
jgi:hypothetical protein